MMFLIRYKGRRGDEKMSDQKKATLKIKWAQIRHRESPLISPVNSDDDLDLQDGGNGNINIEQHPMLGPQVGADGTFENSSDQILMALGNQDNIN